MSAELRLGRVSRTTPTFPPWHTTAALAVLAFQISAIISSCDAVPTDRRFSKRSTEESFADLDTKLNETHPEGTCFLDGILVPQTTVYCERKSGCRAIQKTGYCCPDYKCECEKDGKVFSNGDKLVDPNTPCTVCYCQGGEILCSSVTCYQRDDCQPKYIAGRCCPEYDNCPENTNATSTTSLPGPNDDGSAAKTEIKNNPLGIKIKEITKPEEIRIVDDKPKQKNPRPKPVDSSLANQLKIYLSQEIHQATPAESSSTGPNPLDEELNDLPQTTVAPSGETSDHEQSQSVKIVRQTVPIEGPSEVGDSDKEVVVLDDAKPITVFGVEGLQRVTQSEVTPEEAAPANTYTTDFEPVPSGSDNVYTFVMSTEGPSSTTASADEAMAKNETDAVAEEASSTEGLIETTTAAVTQLSSLAPQHHHPHIEDDDALLEANPAYPTIIEEDLSNYPREIDDYPDMWAKAHHGAKDEPRGSAGFELSKLSKANGTDARPVANTTESVLAETSIEEDSTEILTAHKNQTDREPTTPRYQALLAIDELGSGDGRSNSPENDPKNDAESLKYDDADEFKAPVPDAQTGKQPAN